MSARSNTMLEPRRFLAINFRVGTRANGYLVGPALVSTSDYVRFHFWDEPLAAEIDPEDYEIVKLYSRGLTYDEVAPQFARDFPPALVGTQSAGWLAQSVAFGASDSHQPPPPRVLAA